MMKIPPHIHYISKGQGSPVILTHGMGASLYDWGSLSPALAGAGYRTYALDLPGHGDSDKPADPALYHTRLLYRSYESWIQSLELKRPPVLIGHSLGGYLSLEYALRHPNLVRGMVLLNPFYCPEGQLSPLANLFRRRPDWGEKALRSAPEWFLHTLIQWNRSNQGKFSPQARRQIAQDLKRAAPQIVYIPRSVRDLTDSLPSLKQKTLAIWGDRDLTLRPASFHHLTRALPNASGRSIPGCGHQPHIGHPELVNQWVLDFLSTLPS